MLLSRMSVVKAIMDESSAGMTPVSAFDESVRDCMFDSTPSHVGIVPVMVGLLAMLNLFSAVRSESC